MTETDGEGLTALLLSAHNGNLAVLVWLLEEGGVSDVVDAKGLNALMHGAAAGNLDIVKYLLKVAKFPLAAVDEMGIDVLQSAASQGKANVVKWLLEVIPKTLMMSEYNDSPNITKISLLAQAIYL